MTAAPLRFGAQSATGFDRFDYAPGKPNLYMLMRFKQLLVQEHGLEWGWELYRQTIAAHRNARLVRQRLTGQHPYVKAQAGTFVETVPAGEPFTILPPPVLGAGNHRPLQNVTRSFYVASVENIGLSGRSSVLHVEGLALADFQNDELARIDDEVEFDAAVFYREGDEVWSIISDQEPRVFDAAFSLLGCRTDFFGDWLCDSIPKYVAATLSGHLPPVPVLIDAHMNTSHRQALEMLLLPGTEIVEIAAFESVTVRQLWTAPSIGYMAFHQILNDKFKWDYVMCSPERFAPVEDEMVRRADLVLGDKPSPERVYLARKDFRHRRLVNTAELEAMARAEGFVIVYTEEYDFIEQVRLLRGARHVIAPEGSSLFLRYFLSEGTKICILNHQITEGVVGYNGGAEAKDIALTIITGPEAGERRGRSQDMDYWIDPQVFREFLDSWFKAAER